MKTIFTAFVRNYMGVLSITIPKSDAENSKIMPGDKLLVTLEKVDQNEQ